MISVVYGLEYVFINIFFSFNIDNVIKYVVMCEVMFVLCNFMLFIMMGIVIMIFNMFDLLLDWVEVMWNVIMGDLN